MKNTFRCGLVESHDRDFECGRSGRLVLGVKCGANAFDERTDGGRDATVTKGALDALTVPLFC